MNTVLMMHGDFNENQAFLQFKKGMKSDLILVRIAGVGKIMIQNFETLIVFGDFENGKMTLLDEMKKRFPGVVKAVRQQDYKGCKDANELLQKYGKEAVKQAVNNAERVAIDRVKEIADIEAVDLFSLPKISTGIAGIDKVLSLSLIHI